MDRLYYLSHPEVDPDPNVPVPEWRLNGTGRTRARASAGRGWPANLGHIVSSTERKATETAAIFAEARDLAPEIRPTTREIDRSATGFLPASEFERTVDAFFADPDTRVRGWERARDAQARMVAELDIVLSRHSGGGLLMIGHGTVGTLLWFALSGTPISRASLQPGPGHV